jgi:hypothetical protein
VLTISIGGFLLTALLSLYLVTVTLHNILFLHLLSTNYKFTQPCHFPSATQTYCSEDGDREFFDEEF